MAIESGSIKMRSWLFAPGDSERKMEKATAGTADIVILDLEDAVAESEKPKARSMISAFLTANAAQRKRLWIRINPIQGPHGLADLVASSAPVRAGSCCRSLRGRPDVELLDHYLTALEAACGTDLGTTQVIVLVTETAEAMFTTGSYAGAPRVAAMRWGAEDSPTRWVRVENRTPTAATASPISWRAVFASLAPPPQVFRPSRPFRAISGTKRACASARQKCGVRVFAACWPFTRRKSM